MVVERLFTKVSMFLSILFKTCVFRRVWQTKQIRLGANLV